MSWAHVSTKRKAPRKGDLGLDAIVHGSGEMDEASKPKLGAASSGAVVVPSEPVTYTAASLHKMYKVNSSLIDPRRSNFLPVWDVVMLLALFFTATVTPYEVTFLDSKPCITPLFVVNQLT